MNAASEKGERGGRRKGPATVAREYFGAIARQDLDAAAALWAPDGVDRLHGLAELEGPQGFRAYFAELFRAFPDLEFEVVELCASGKNAAVRWRIRAAFEGPGRFQGLKPTGARIDIQGCDMLRIEDERIVENNAYVNGAQLAEQLGVLPATDSPAGRAMTVAFNLRTAAVEAAGRLARRLRS